MMAMTIRGAGMLAILLATGAAAAGARDPFEFFKPSVTVGVDDRRQLDHGEPIARVIPSVAGEIAVFAAVPIHVDTNRLVAWMRRIEELKRSSYVPAIGRISEPPRIEDLAGLELDDEDLSDVLVCRPGNCAIALSAPEMTQLHQAAVDSGSDWKAGVQLEFRRVVLQRIKAFLADGQPALAPFSMILEHSTFLGANAPLFAEYLARYPHAPMTGVESFLYWSKERLAGKPIAIVTHVSMLRAQGEAFPDVLVAGRQVFATRYITASLGVTALVPGERGVRYLVYVNRSQVDVLNRWFGGLVRWFAERRVQAEAAEVLRGLRMRLERGEPPGITEDRPR
jgi:hypothetical protein